MDSRFWHRFSTTILTFFFVLATEQVMDTYFQSALLNKICIVIMTVAWLVFCATIDYK